MERRAEARRQLDDLVERFQSGDTSVAQRIDQAGRQFLQASLAVNGATEAYGSDANLVQSILRDLGAAQMSEADLLRDQLTELRAIHQTMIASQDSGSGGSIDFGRNEARNRAIYAALEAASLPTPSGFGQGQLNALRAQNATVNAVVSAMGFNTGGVVAGDGVRGQDLLLARVDPAERILSEQQSRDVWRMGADLSRIASNQNFAPVVKAIGVMVNAINRQSAQLERWERQQGLERKQARAYQGAAQGVGGRAAVGW